MQTPITITINLFLILMGNALFANNIQVENVKLGRQNKVANYYMVQFDLSWENSWRTSTYESNWDAAWVFIKFSPRNQQNWQHATLAQNGHSNLKSMTVSPTPDGVGVFIYRGIDGIGDVNYDKIQIKWNYGVDGVGDFEKIKISVHAIEMVYVPTGAFYLGDGGEFGAGFEAGTSGTPYLVNSELAITLGGGGGGSLGNNNAWPMHIEDDFNDVSSQVLPHDFPKGYTAFYCMKYEASKQQYADFLAKLTTPQREARNGPFFVDGTDIFGIQDGDYWATAQYPARAMEGLSWLDVATYLDWAGLRPMSELEFEKACRGPVTPVLEEHAWGHNNGYSVGAYTYQFEGTPQEVITSGLGINIGNYNTGEGSEEPVRCGIFAASATNKTREETGATYWGIMEMNGNCYEPVISVGSSQTRDFSGLHGNGSITASGNASFTLLSDWAFANAVGVGHKNLYVSSRYFANRNNPAREEWYGIRGVRTAP